jgi:hypothetical protein
MRLDRQALFDSIKNAWRSLFGGEKPMHPCQKGFVDAFKTWDGDGMADALIRIAQEMGEFECSAETKAKITWSCRELLAGMEVHPLTGTLIFVPEGPFTFVLDGGVQPSSGAAPARYAKVTLKLALSALDPDAVKRRWRRLGLVGEVLTIDREEVRTPAPLKGEPGFAGYQPGKPSIHRPSRVLMAPTSQRYARALDAEARDPKVYLERYRAGECERVWAELLALGAGIRDEAILPDAVAVARETMRRCRENVERLAERLRALGYLFGSPGEAFVPPEADVLERIAEIEDRVGPIPLSLCAWYEIVGSVDFTGSHPNWTEGLIEVHKNPDESADERLICAYPDPLVVYPGRYTLAYDEENWYREAYRLDLAPDEYHKEDVSGGPPYTIRLPNPAVDAPLEHERHGTSFVDYLRTCFRWGGFPGWERLADDNVRRAILAELAKDLLFV